MLFQYLKTMTFFFNTLLQIFIIIIFWFFSNSGLKILFTYYLSKGVFLILTDSIITEFISFSIESGTDSDSNSDIESYTESDHSYSDTDIECQKSLRLGVYWKRNLSRKTNVYPKNGSETFRRWSFKAIVRCSFL